MDDALALIGWAILIGIGMIGVVVAAAQMRFWFLRRKARRDIQRIIDGAAHQ